MTATAATRLPVVSYLRLEPEPILVGSKCRRCGSLYVLRRTACAKCGNDDLETGVELSRAGRVTTATIIFRAPKGVQTPFCTGVVELDDGAYVRATLVGPGTDDPVSLVGKPVHLITSSVGQDSRGVEAVGFSFATEESK